nr:hypothetical protein BaRGS_011313 [Batillaria attramentaria]
MSPCRRCLVKVGLNHLSLIQLDHQTNSLMQTPSRLQVLRIHRHLLNSILILHLSRSLVMVMVMVRLLLVIPAMLMFRLLAITLAMLLPLDLLRIQPVLSPMGKPTLTRPKIQLGTEFRCQQKPVVTVIDDGSRDPTAKGSSSQGPPPGIFDIPGKTSPTSTNSNARGGSNSPSIRLPSEAFQNPFQNPSSPLGNRRDQFGNSNPAYVGTSLFSEGFIDSPGGVSPSLAGVPKGPDPVDEGAYQIFPGFQQFEKTAGSGMSTPRSGVFSIFGQPSGGSRRGAGSGIGQVDFGTRNAGLNRGGAANGGFFNSPSTQAAGGVFSQNFLANPGRTNFITPRRSRGFEGSSNNNNNPNVAFGFGLRPKSNGLGFPIPTNNNNNNNNNNNPSTGFGFPSRQSAPGFGSPTPQTDFTQGFGSDDGQFGFPGSFGSFNDQNFDKNGFDNSEFTDDLFNGKGSTSEDSETTSSSSSGNSSAPA